MVNSTHTLPNIFNTSIKILGIVLIFNYKVLPTPNTCFMRLAHNYHYLVYAIFYTTMALQGKNLLESLYNEAIDLEASILKTYLFSQQTCKSLLMKVAQIDVTV